LCSASIFGDLAFNLILDRPLNRIERIHVLDFDLGPKTIGAESSLKYSHHSAKNPLYISIANAQIANDSTNFEHILPLLYRCFGMSGSDTISINGTPARL
jgi:hypothetical protein